MAGSERNAVRTAEPDPPYGREPTEEERERASKLYPRLASWKVTAEATDAYNCIGWTLCGEDFGWIDPRDTLAEQDEFYASHGFVVSATCEPECKKRKVAVYCKDGKPVHGAKEVADGGWYESKRGNNVRIIHQRSELEGGFYGDVCRCHEKRDETANLGLCPT